MFTTTSPYQVSTFLYYEMINYAFTPDCWLLLSECRELLCSILRFKFSRYILTTFSKVHKILKQDTYIDFKMCIHCLNKIISTSIVAFGGDFNFVNLCFHSKYPNWILYEQSTFHDRPVWKLARAITSGR